MISFEDFHRQRRAQTLHYATVILGPDAAQDACQEAWVRVWRAWDSAQPERLDGWLMTILRNCCYDRLRSRRRVESLEQPGADVLERSLEEHFRFEDGVVAAVDLQGAWERLEYLSPPLREALWLRVVMDMSYAEIAEFQGVSIGTVMSRLHAARRQAARVLRREVRG